VTIDRDATFHGASFSPSSDEIVWARQSGRAYSTERGIDIVRARVDGSARARLVTGGRNAAPAWGSRTIAFGRIRPGRIPQFPIYELWTMTARGDELRRVTRTSHIPVDWSHDGRVLLTATYGPSRSVMSIVEPATGDVRVLLADRFLFPQALSQDGRSALAWVWDRKIKPSGNLVRAGSDGTRRILVRRADDFADWNV
jgi:Tol biopolymer transport system component